jgi:hypothetical protein
MEDQDEGVVKTALLVAFGVIRKIRGDLNDWKEWLVIEGKKEMNEYDPKLATKEDIKDLSRKIDEACGKKPAETLFKRDEPQEHDHR